MPGQFRMSREVWVPQLENGFLHYIIMEIIAASDGDSGWSVKDLPSQPYPTATGPTAGSFTAMDSFDPQNGTKMVPQVPASGGNWTSN